MNPDKTEFIIFGSEAQRKQLSHLFLTKILGNDLTPVNKVCNLGVIFYAAFSFTMFTDQVNNIRKSCYCQIRDFSRMRKFLPKSVAITLANPLVSSRLDYCYSLLRGIKDQDLCRLQGIQNNLCRIITGASTYTSITPHFRLLRLLTIKYRIVFKHAS